MSICWGWNLVFAHGLYFRGLFDAALHEDFFCKYLSLAVKLSEPYTTEENMDKRRSVR